MDATAERNRVPFPTGPDLLCPYHLRVVLRLVALVGDIVEHHTDRPSDDDPAFNPCHCLPRLPICFHQTQAPAQEVEAKVTGRRRCFG
jgi:hypothetical protein